MEKRLKEARKHAGFTQPQLAKSIGVSLKSIKNYEKDASKIAVNKVKKIALECGVNEIWLLTGQRGMFDNNIDKVTKVVIEHQDMVKRFKDPERAKDINERLLEIEELSDDIYNKVDGYIEASRDAARAIKGTKKNHTERSSEKKQANGK